jgi:hypothetical protein
MQIHTEFREIPGKIYYKNTAEFRVFKKIPYSAGSDKNTSVDTLLESIRLYCEHKDRINKEEIPDTDPHGSREVKGTVARDFLLLVIFMYQFPPSFPPAPEYSI